MTMYLNTCSPTTSLDKCNNSGHTRALNLFLCLSTCTSIQFIICGSVYM